jgi:putative nucleotidyltransferase with HDIG domain
MKLEWTFLRSKVARRIFLLFVLCALLPIAALAIVSFGHVTQELNRQSQRRLHQASKAIALGIYERLLLLEGEMRIVASTLTTGTGTSTLKESDLFGEGVPEHFMSLEFIGAGGRHNTLFGRMEDPPELTAAERKHMAAGKTLLSSRAGSDMPSRTVMAMALDPRDPKRGMLLGEVNTTYLWGMGDENALPPNTELCVLDHAITILACTLPGRVSLPEQVTRDMTQSAAGQFEWRHEEGEFLASYWTIPLQFRFFVPTWIVVLGESKADVLAPTANFKTIFLLVILMTLWIVLLLSVNQIRRSLVPLEKLQDGTRRIAMRDFGTRVTVTSGDEFEDLAGSFNTMASRLGRQFNTLATMAEIDRAILSTLDTRKIVDVVLTRIGDVLPCDGIGVTLLESNGTRRAQTYLGGADDSREGDAAEETELAPGEMERLRAHPDTLLLEAPHDLPRYLAPLTRRGLTSFVVLPIFLKDNLEGIISLGFRGRPQHSPEDLTQARQLADQVAVALSNARLIEELDKLNWGTLTALARAIDAKSPWTAGHSERVTQLAVKIGRKLGLGPRELEVLHRGGLLHDIGKIGIPAVILDKAGRLTPEEVTIMREHPRKGARILEPIPAYADVIPIVLHHHEWFDGTGYPDGLAGEAISLGPRIFAVADVFDAISSDRPYRKGQDRDGAIAFITQGAGRQFDPRVVQAFVEVMAEERAALQEHPTPSTSIV